MLYPVYFFELLIFKTKCRLRAEVSRLYLNYIWWAIEPLLTMAVFYTVFGIFMNSPTPHFGLFILIGTTQWQWFATTVLHASNSITDTSFLISHVAIHKIFFPLEIFLQDSFKHLFVILLFSIFLCFYPVPAGISWVSLPLVLLLQGELILGCSILFAAVVPFIPDLRFVLPTIINIIFFVSGIFFDVDIYVLPEHRPFMYLNPMAGFIREYRHIIIDGQWPDWEYLCFSALGCTLLLAAAIYIIHRHDKFYPRLCQQ